MLLTLIRWSEEHASFSSAQAQRAIAYLCRSLVLLGGVIMFYLGDFELVASKGH